jgi:hypothetical protein
MESADRICARAVKDSRARDSFQDLLASGDCEATESESLKANTGGVGTFPYQLFTRGNCSPAIGYQPVRPIRLIG